MLSIDDRAAEREAILEAYEEYAKQVTEGQVTEEPLYIEGTYRHVRLDRFFTDEGIQDCTFVVRVEDGVLTAGVAICSPKDNYCKKSGRIVARYAKPTLNSVYDPRLSILENIWYALRQAYRDDLEVPDRWRRAYESLSMHLGLFGD